LDRCAGDWSVIVVVTDFTGTAVWMISMMPTRDTRRIMARE